MKGKSSFDPHGETLAKGEYFDTLDYYCTAVTLNAATTGVILSKPEEWNSTTSVKHYDSINYFDSGKSAAASAFSLQKPKSILFFGDSVDRFSVHDTCNSPELPHGQVFCKSGDFTLIYHLNFGSGASPWHAMSQLEQDGYALDSIPEYLKRTVKPFVVEHKVETPDLVVVNNNLWDLAKMWDESKEAGEVSEEVLQKWCRKDVPNMLQMVQDTFPTSKIIFRTQPVVESKRKFKGFVGLVPALDFMAECIKRELKGKTDIIDFHAIMKQYLTTTTNRLSAWRKDLLHPSPILDTKYINEVLNYAAAL